MSSASPGGAFNRSLQIMSEKSPIKQAKAELLLTAGKSEPPAAFVAQDDIMDMMLREYFNPASKLPPEMTLNAITTGAQMCKAGAEITEAQVKTILEKYKAPTP